MSKFESFQADFIVFVRQVDDNGGVFLADHDSVGGSFAGMDPDSWVKYFDVLVVETGVEFYDWVGLGVEEGAEEGREGAFFLRNISLGNGGSGVFADGGLGDDVERFWLELQVFVEEVGDYFLFLHGGGVEV